MDNVINLFGEDLPPNTPRVIGAKQVIEGILEDAEHLSHVLVYGVYKDRRVGAYIGSTGNMADLNFIANCLAHDIQRMSYTVMFPQPIDEG